MCGGSQADIVQGTFGQLISFLSSCFFENAVVVLLLLLFIVWQLLLLFIGAGQNSAGNVKLNTFQHYLKQAIYTMRNTQRLHF